MHMPAAASFTTGRVLSSAGETIAIGQTTEQIPHRVQRSWSTTIFAIIYCSFCVLFVPFVSGSFRQSMHSWHISRFPNDIEHPDRCKAWNGLLLPENLTESWRRAKIGKSAEAIVNRNSSETIVRNHAEKYPCRSFPVLLNADLSVSVWSARTIPKKNCHWSGISELFKKPFDDNDHTYDEENRPQ
jgi:hypothetical protein